MTPRRLHAHEDPMSTFRRVHFIGIGGVGMSGIAEVLHNLGYAVSGSDRAHSPTAQRLQQLGIVVHVGHAVENIGDADVVVTSSAIKQDNPELFLFARFLFRQRLIQLFLGNHSFLNKIFSKFHKYPVKVFSLAIIRIE